MKRYKLLQWFELMESNDGEFLLPPGLVIELSEKDARLGLERGMFEEIKDPKEEPESQEGECTDCGVRTSTGNTTAHYLNCPSHFEKEECKHENAKGYEFGELIYCEFCHDRFQPKEKPSEWIGVEACRLEKEGRFEGAERSIWCRMLAIENFLDEYWIGKQSSHYYPTNDHD